MSEFDHAAGTQRPDAAGEQTGPGGTGTQGDGADYTANTALDELEEDYPVAEAMGTIQEKEDDGGFYGSDHAPSLGDTEHEFPLAEAMGTVLEREDRPRL